MTELSWVLCLVASTIACFAFLGWIRGRSRVSRANRARQEVASDGELAAERLLERRGFTILDRQVTVRWHIEVDGEPFPCASRADLLVQKRGRQFVAEVKTGSRAPDPTTPQTRRQLLEYLMAFPVHGALLVDMERRTIHEIRFPHPPG
jgi:Holliday junction resolvase-like predicted endonuclease